MGSVFRIGAIDLKDTGIYHVHLLSTSENDKQLTDLTKFMGQWYITNPPSVCDIVAILFKQGHYTKTKEVCEKILLYENRPDVQANIFNEWSVDGDYFDPPPLWFFMSIDSTFDELQNGIQISKKKPWPPNNVLGILVKSPDFEVFWPNSDYISIRKVRILVGKNIIIGISAQKLSIFVWFLIIFLNFYFFRKIQLYPSPSGEGEKNEFERNLAFTV